MRSLARILVALSCPLLLVPAVFGQEETSKAKPEIPRQPGDDVAKPLDSPLSEKTKTRLDAESWFMAGKIEQRKGRNQQAYEAFQKALSLDPNGVEIYRELIPLAFALNKPAEAARLAQKAVELDPDDYETLQQLSRLAARSNRVGDALGLIDRALKSKRLDKFSLEAVSLNLDLLNYSSAGQQMNRAIDACDVLFAALKDPRRYKLDARAQRTLAQQTELIGNVYAAAGKRSKAIEVFAEQARVRGDRPGTHNFSLARLYFIEKDFENAEKQLLEYFETRPKEMLAYRLYSQILQSSNRKDEILPNLEKFAETDKQNAGLQYFVADLYVQADRLDEAEDIIKRAIRSSGNPAGYLGLAEVYRKQKKPKNLLDALVKAQRGGVDTDPLIGRIASDTEISAALLEAGKMMLEDDPEALDYRTNYMLGRVAAAAEKSDEAISFLRNALQLGNVEQVPMVSLDLGTQLLFTDKYEEAATVFENGLKSRPRTPPERNRVVFLLYRLSQAHAFADKNDDAIKTLKRAQAMPEGNIPLLHYQEGWTYFRANEIDKAEEKLQEVLRRYNTDPDTTMRTRALLASVHSQQRDFPTAIEEFESIIRDYAQNKETVRSARMSLSNLYISKGDQQKAEAILEEVLKGDPNDPGVNNDLGYLYADQNKNLEQAEKMIRIAVDSAPENAAYLDSLGWVLYRRGKYAEAIEWLEKAIELPGGEDSTIIEHLGDNLDKIGKKDEALKRWQESLKVEQSAAYPDDSVVKRLQDKIKAASGE
ncbi:MAG: tetratricopeptide repeat protein [Planctomycetaceae bacterium]